MGNPSQRASNTNSFGQKQVKNWGHGKSAMPPKITRKDDFNSFANYSALAVASPSDVSGNDNSVHSQYQAKKVLFQH